MWNIGKVISKGDYNYCIIKEHPKATKHGYVLMHRAVMENHLGRLLDDDEVVHHKNGDKKDNRICNLEVLNASEHVSMHGFSRGAAYVEARCPMCEKLFIRKRRNTHLQKPGQRATFCSRECNARFWTTIGRTHKVEEAISRNIVREFKLCSLDNHEETD